MSKLNKEGVITLALCFGVAHRAISQVLSSLPKDNNMNTIVFNALISQIDGGRSETVYNPTVESDNNTVKSI